MNKRNTGAMLRQNFSALKRAVKKLFGYYPRLAPLTAFCILFSAVVSSVPSLFIQNVLAVPSPPSSSRTSLLSLRTGIGQATGPLPDPRSSAICFSLDRSMRCLWSQSLCTRS